MVRLTTENAQASRMIDFDAGKPYSVSLNEDLAEVAGTLKYYAGWADKIHGQVIDTTTAKLAYTIREPIGVCAQIIRRSNPIAISHYPHTDLDSMGKYTEGQSAPRHVSDICLSSALRF